MANRERWAAVPGWEGFYEVSTLARCRRLLKGRPPRLLTAWPDKHGRFRFKLRRPGARLDVRRYLLVARAFLGPCPAGLEVNHKDHDKTNDVLRNLEYRTRSYNMRHSYRHGRTRCRGDRHGRCVVPDAKLPEVASRVAGGESYASVGKSLGVSATQIMRIVRGRRLTAN